jgi:hypothetical protein
MERIEKKHLKRMLCPKCQRAKLRFEPGINGEPDGGTGAQRKLRCDVCKVNYLEGDGQMQASLNEALSDMTPMPVAVRR